MLNRLVASAPARRGPQSAVGGVVSLLFHALFIFAAVQLTRNGQSRAGVAAFDTTLVFIEAESEEEPESPAIRLDDVASGFVALLPPVSVPTSIPPIDLAQRFDPRDYTGVGLERPADVAGARAAAVGPGQAWIEAAVDEKPEIVWSPPLKYPDLLRAAGLEGSVLVEVIIDADGKPEPASLRIVHSTHQAFEPPARDVVLKTVYRAGRVGGEAVRVLVNVPVSFSIRRRDT